MFRAFPPPFRCGSALDLGVLLPKRNYGFEKRQKELSKQRQKEEKRLRKLQRRGVTEDSTDDKAPPKPAPLEE
jgi:hypothetical protein